MHSLSRSDQETYAALATRIQHARSPKLKIREEVGKTGSTVCLYNFQCIDGFKELGGLLSFLNSVSK